MTYYYYFMERILKVTHHCHSPPAVLGTFKLHLKGLDNFFLHKFISTFFQKVMCELYHSKYIYSFARDGTLLEPTVVISLPCPVPHFLVMWWPVSRRGHRAVNVMVDSLYSSKIVENM
jgi:hypothetical protein